MAEDRTDARDKPRQLRGQKAPSTSQALAVATLFPIGGILLALSGLTLTGTLIGLAVAFPLFLLFSPILVPAAGLIGLALAGLFTSGAMGATAVVALSCGARVVARVFSQENMKRMKRQIADAAGQVRQKTKDVGHGIQSRTHEAVRT